METYLYFERMLVSVLRFFFSGKFKTTEEIKQVWLIPVQNGYLSKAGVPNLFHAKAPETEVASGRGPPNSKTLRQNM